jgi:hypothetical protein
MPKKPKGIEWRVSEVRSKGHYLGTVSAPTLEEALKVAAKEFGLSEQRAKRLIAQPKA